MRVLMFVPFIFLAGCAISPLIQLEEDIQSQDLNTRLAAVNELSNWDNVKARELLVEAFESDPELLEAAGNALVVVGRRYDIYFPPSKQTWMNPNPVLRDMGIIVARSSLDCSIRAKAVWIMGEIGNRKAKQFITLTYTADSTRVAKEVAMARDKLGFTNHAVAFELLNGGEFSTSYEPRWEIE